MIPPPFAIGMCQQFRTLARWRFRLASLKLPFSLGQWDSEIRGDSDSAWQPNGMVRTAAEVGGEKMGGGEKRAVASDTTAAAHLFPFFTVCGTPFRLRR